MKLKRKFSNLPMSLGIITVAATLMTSVLLGSTLAKYVTEGYATDTARVAKWGVSVATTGGTGFNTSYIGTDFPPDGELTSNVTVQSSNATDTLVAPGTTGTIAASTISGTPEVAVKVEYSLEPLSGTQIFTGRWFGDNGSAGYYPVQLSLDGDHWFTCSEGEIPSDLTTALAGATQYYAANTNLATIQDTTQTIQWKWDFGNQEAGPNDAKDTYLGDIAATPDIPEEEMPKIALNYKVTVTQVD